MVIVVLKKAVGLLSLKMSDGSGKKMFNWQVKRKIEKFCSEKSNLGRRVKKVLIYASVKKYFLSEKLN